MMTKSLKSHFWSTVVCWTTFAWLLCPLAWAQEPDESGITGTGEILETEITAEQFIPEAENKQRLRAMAAFSVEERRLLQINESIRNLIEENKKFLKENKEFQFELETLRGQNIIRVNRIRALTRQRDDLNREAEKLRKSAEEKEKQLGELKATAEKTEAELKKQLRDMAINLEMQANSGAAGQASQQQPAGAVSADNPGLQKVREENMTLKNEAAKVHYNLGNVHFQQGEYEKAAVEYDRAVVLAPHDAEAHYNLAFVSGEYLGDQETALRHYQQYLYLKPGAEDFLLVKEKILVARLTLQNRIDSPIDQDPKSRKRPARKASSAR